VKRLLELARIGNTSIEWILTGRHWENGSPEMDRMQGEVFELAQQLHAFTPQERRALTSALEILQAASHHLRTVTGRDIRELNDAEIGRSVRTFETHVLEPLVAALSVYDAVVTTLARARVRELHTFSQGEAEPRRSDDMTISGPALQKNAG
jgi:hypothetical protein